MKPSMRASSFADAGVSATTKVAAFSIVTILLAATLLGAIFGSVAGPVVPVFIVVCSTLWCVGDLLTGFLLYAHFRVTGRIVFLVVASAYAITGALSIPYSLAFPGIFISGTEFQQISVSLWLSWHAVFALVIGTYFALDPEVRARLVDERAIKRLGAAVLSATIILALAIAVPIGVFHARLPHFVETGRFTYGFTHVATPALAVLGVSACLVVAFWPRRATALHLWLAVSLLSMALDSFLNSVSASRYSLSWYIGKFETLLTATLLLGVLLQEIAKMYEQITTFAMRDPLTGLRNRRSFDESAAWMLDLSKRRRTPIAVLMIDIDHFKRFNDSFGHAAGDECISTIAQALRANVSRGADLLARYGGEEFVVMLADVDAEGASVIADRLLRSVRGRTVNCREFGEQTVTVSIGMVWTSQADPAAGLRDLLGMADGVLYEAKASGRDRCVAVVSNAQDRAVAGFAE